MLMFLGRYSHGLGKCGFCAFIDQLWTTIEPYMKSLQILIVLLSTCFLAHGQEQESPIDERIIIREVSTDKLYGRKKKTNVKVGSVRNEYAYVSQLTGPNGEELEVNRLGSCCDVKAPLAPFGKAPLDRWEIKYEGLDEPIILYLNGYDYEQPKCPLGLSFKKL